MTIERRMIEVARFYCTECGDDVGQMVTCPRCRAKTDCAEGRHRLMFSSAYTEETMEKECLFCRTEFRVTLVIS